MMRKGKEKERNRKNRKYGQAKLKHAKKGITSCVIAGIVLVLLAALLAVAYISEGAAAPYVGGFGVTAFVLACVGCSMGFRGFREREKNYLTCKVGVGCNIFFVVGFIAIFCRGLF